MSSIAIRRALLAGAVAGAVVAAAGSPAVPDAGVRKLACAELLEVPNYPRRPEVSEATRLANREKWLARKQVFSRLPLTGLLKGPDDDLDVEIYERLTVRLFEDLSPDEQRFYAVVELEGQVHNGGFDQYFFNNTGNRASFAREGLVLFEEPEADGGRTALRLVDCAFEAFPNHRPSANPFAREEQLARWGAEKARLFSRLDTVFNRTRINYSAVRRVRAHPELFPSLAQPLPQSLDGG